MESVEKMGMKTIEYVNVSKYNTSRRMACMANTVGWQRWDRYFLRIGDFHKYLIKGEI
jgi:hypothetical protein